ncbi:MAG: 30S ribosomal protein S4 [Candidatus Thorarchaeota archaeon]|nr:MAG: 30S ribosomal protein S4 [Candidatus Thorarchaeota archaeon]
MGDIRFQSKKYVMPKRPFDTDRFEQELQLIGTFGLRNKKEIWIHRTELSHYRRTARYLLALPPSERAHDERELVDKLSRLGILSGDLTLDNVLNLTLEKVLERRLQTIVFRKGLAASMHHARQLVTHGHIGLNDRRVTTPARLITTAEEEHITYTTKSALNDQSHPARIAASDAATRITAVPEEIDEERPRRRLVSMESVDEREPLRNEPDDVSGDEELE